MYVRFNCMTEIQKTTFRYWLELSLCLNEHFCALFVCFCVVVRFNHTIRETALKIIHLLCEFSDTSKQFIQWLCNVGRLSGLVQIYAFPLLTGIY